MCGKKKKKKKKKRNVFEERNINAQLPSVPAERKFFLRGFEESVEWGIGFLNNIFCLQVNRSQN